MGLPKTLQRNVALAPRTTLGLGGPAAFFASVRNTEELATVLDFAGREGLPRVILGEGSNIVVSDDGFAGVVIDLRIDGFKTEASSPDILSVGAGMPWAGFVHFATKHLGLSGVECLAGIPGRVGATPIQNVGAYGQEVSDSIVDVTVFDPKERNSRTIPAKSCGFGYRDSRFKRTDRDLIITSVRFGLARQTNPTVRYGELVELVGPQAKLASIHDAVLALRRKKSMVLDPSDPNTKSAGSFFMNPLMTTAEADAVQAAAQALHPSNPMPRFPTKDNQVKLSAAWLIEHAGFARGMRQGAVGISQHHALALVHHGGGTTGALIDLARQIFDAVRSRFGVLLRPEPVWVGFERNPLA